VSEEAEETPLTESQQESQFLLAVHEATDSKLKTIVDDFFHKVESETAVRLHAKKLKSHQAGKEK